MKKAMLLLTVLGLAGSLWAANPYEGTWKLNLAKSKPGAGGLSAAKELTVVHREVGTDLETVFTGTDVDGKPISAKFMIPLQGGVLGFGQESAQMSAEGNLVVITVISPGEMYGTSIQKGKQVEVTHTFVSRDGKTMNRTSKGVDAQGKPYETLMVFDKQ